MNPVLARAWAEKIPGGDEAAEDHHQFAEHDPAAHFRLLPDASQQGPAS